MIKESEVLERIGMSIDALDLDELAILYNRLYVESYRDNSNRNVTSDDFIVGADIELEEGWHLVPKEGAH